MLRFEAIAHNTAELRCGRMIDKFPDIVTRTGRHRRAIRHRLGLCGHRIPRRRRPRPTAHRIDTRPRPHRRCRPEQTADAERAKAVLALAPAPNGFTVAEFTAKVHAMTGHPAPPTASARPPTTCARSAANSCLTNPHGLAVTTSHPKLHAPSPPCSPSATRSSPRSWPRCAARAWDANPRTGPASTVTTNESVSICKRSSAISPSKPR